MGVVDMSPARRSLLVQVFQQMDNTGNGSISIAEYRSAVASQTMLSFFEYLDAQGVADGEVTLVRVRSGAASSASSNPASLASALRAAWPLAHVGVVENFIEGTFEAQVVVPPVKEQRELAHAAMARRVWAGRMATLGLALVWASAATFGGIVVAHMAT